MLLDKGADVNAQDGREILCGPSTITRRSKAFPDFEDDKRMRTELIDAFEKNDPGSFSYTRHDDSGLRVPKHTTISGERVQRNDGNSVSPLSNLELSPGFHSGGSATGSGSDAAQPQCWYSAGHAGMSFKDEDDLMKLNS